MHLVHYFNSLNLQYLTSGVLQGFFRPGDVLQDVSPLRQITQRGVLLYVSSRGCPPKGVKQGHVL
jgi:hypothetical protein